MNYWFGRYDWRMRNRFLGIGALVMAVVCFQLAIKPTLRMRDAFQQQKRADATRTANLDELARLRAATRQVGLLSAGRVPDSGHPDAFRSEPERIAQYASRYGAQVRTLPVSEKVHVETLQMEYTQYLLEGGFITLVQLLHDIERTGDVHVTNVYFKKQQHPVSRLPMLHLQLGTARVSKEHEGHGNTPSRY